MKTGQFSSGEACSTETCLPTLGLSPPLFPLQILALILVRKMLDFVFSQHDLAWIDNIIPEKEKKKEDDKKKKKKGNRGEDSSEEEVGPQGSGE